MQEIWYVLLVKGSLDLQMGHNPQIKDYCSRVYINTPWKQKRGIIHSYWKRQEILAQSSWRKDFWAELEKAVIGTQAVGGTKYVHASWQFPASSHIPLQLYDKFQPRRPPASKAEWLKASSIFLFAVFGSQVQTLWSLNMGYWHHCVQQGPQ